MDPYSLTFSILVAVVTCIMCCIECFTPSFITTEPLYIRTRNAPFLTFKKKHGVPPITAAKKTPERT